MGLFGRTSYFTCAAAVGIWFMYGFALLHHVYETTIKVPKMQRIVRDVAKLRLPSLYFCPADRGRSNSLRWHTYECKLSYKDEHRVCPARLEAYLGREPEEFRNTIDAEGAPKLDGGECVEFDTHDVAVREEWSAAWNEVILRAAFVPPAVTGVGDALQEVELGYLSAEWEIGNRPLTVERRYYPLLRVPFFWLDVGQRTPGVATRSYLGREVDKGLKTAGKYWYTYGAMRITVANATMPQEAFPNVPWLPLQRMGVVHVVITLEDFEEFDFQVVGCFFPMLQAFGQIAGVGALLALGLAGSFRRIGSRGTRGAVDPEAEPASCVDPAGGPQYERIAAPEDDEGSAGEEAQALLGGPRDRDRGPPAGERVAGHALLSTEEGLDGL